jgi:hypothetical protein
MMLGGFAARCRRCHGTAVVAGTAVDADVAGCELELALASDTCGSATADGAADAAFFAAPAGLVPVDGAVTAAAATPPATLPAVAALGPGSALRVTAAGSGSTVLLCEHPCKT